MPISIRVIVSILSLTSLFGCQFSGISGAAESCENGGASAERSEARQSLDELNVAINAAFAEMKRGTATFDEAMRVIGPLLRERARLIHAELEREPGLLIESGLPRAMVNELPASLQACLETPIHAAGRLRIRASAGPGGERIESILLGPDGESYSLHFPDGGPKYRTGDAIAISGLRAPCESSALGADRPTDDVVVTSAPPRLERDAQDAATLPAHGSFGEQRTLAILVNFSDKAGTETVAGAQSLLFDGSRSVSRYFLENSFGQTWLSGAVAGPYRISQSSASCDVDTLADQARAAARASGIDLGAYTRYVYVFPRNACSWLGLGTIGGYPSESWINGSFVLHTVAHELGHNLGLYHANALSCASGSLGGSCTTLEYGDTTDVMGKVPGHLNAFHKEELGWLGQGGQPPIRTVERGGIFELSPLAAQDSRTKALKILKSASSSGGRTYFYVEYRQPIGFDDTFDDLWYANNLTAGLVIHTGNDTRANSSFLVKADPQAISWYKAALDPGRTFHDPVSGVTITLLAADGRSALVNVNGGPVAGETACPR